MRMEIGIGAAAYVPASGAPGSGAPGTSPEGGARRTAMLRGAAGGVGHGLRAGKGGTLARGHVVIMRMRMSRIRDKKRPPVNHPLRLPQSPFTLTGSRLDVDACRSSPERGRPPDAGVPPANGPQDRRRSMRAGYRRPPDAPFPGRPCRAPLRPDRTGSARANRFHSVKRPCDYRARTGPARGGRGSKARAPRRWGRGRAGWRGEGGETGAGAGYPRPRARSRWTRAYPRGWFRTYGASTVWARGSAWKGIDA